MKASAWKFPNCEKMIERSSKIKGGDGGRKLKVFVHILTLFRRGKSVSSSERFELHMLHFLLFESKNQHSSDLETWFTAETRAMRSATYRWCEGNFSGSEEFPLNFAFLFCRIIRLPKQNCFSCYPEALRAKQCLKLSMEMKIIKQYQARASMFEILSWAFWEKFAAGICTSGAKNLPKRPHFRFS